MSNVAVGLDIGGTQIRTVLADAAGNIRARHTALTKAEEGPEAVLARINAAVAAVIPAGQRVAAIGVGAPGPVDPYEGVILMGPNLPGWRNVNLRLLLGAEFQTPVFVGNDANLAGLAEHRYGAGQGVSHMIYITLSTGLGTGVIIDNRMLLGRRGLAAEIGHITIDAEAEQDGDNLIGTLEKLTSGPNLARRARALLRAGAQSSLAKYAADDFAGVTPATLNEAAHAGDCFAREQWRKTGYYLGVGITNMLHTFNPERIVIGGSVWMHARDLLEDVVWATLRARAQSPEYWQELSIVTAALGDDVGLLGAVALAFDGLRGAREA
jgi:glucokinase